jgi:hypothetical protein
MNRWMDMEEEEEPQDRVSSVQLSVHLRFFEQAPLRANFEEQY